MTPQLSISWWHASSGQNTFLKCLFTWVACLERETNLLLYLCLSITEPELHAQELTLVKQINFALQLILENVQDLQDILNPEEPKVTKMKFGQSSLKWDYYLAPALEIPFNILLLSFDQWCIGNYCL